MSDTGNRDDGEASGEEESLAPRSRKRRGLRVPVDDVPRQSFVDLARPSRESGVGRESAVGAEARRASAPDAAAVVDADAIADSMVTAPRARVPSVELSLDADLEVEPTPPPPPRSYRPPPPPPSWSTPASAPTPAATRPSQAPPAMRSDASLGGLARAVSVANEGGSAEVEVEAGFEAPHQSPREDEQLFGAGDAGDELAAEPTRVSAPLERPQELDWTGEATPAPIPHETTKVGKKRSSAPPEEAAEARAPGVLPDDPLEAPRRAWEQPPTAQDVAPPTVEPETAEPDAAEPATAEPETAEPAGAEPAAAEPAGANPAGANPAGAERAMAEAPEDERMPTSPGETAGERAVTSPSPVASSVSRASRPPLATDSRETPRGLFGGSGSTEVALPVDEPPSRARTIRGGTGSEPGAGHEDFADTVFAEVEAVPRARRITTAMPVRRGSIGSDPPDDPRPSLEGEGLDESGPAEVGASPRSASPELTAGLESAPHEGVRPESAGVERPAREGAGLARTDIAAGPAATPETAGPPNLEITETPSSPLIELLSGETLAGLGAPTKSSPGVVMIAPVVVSRAVTVIGSPSAAPPEPRVAYTTPGGVIAPASNEAWLEPVSSESVSVDLADRESDPGVPLELDLPAADDSDLLEMASQPAPAKAAPPPPAPSVAKPPAPPKPPPPSAPSPQISAAEQPAPLPSRPPPKKKNQWWEELFSDDYLRTVPVPSQKSIHKQVDFIQSRLGLAKGAAILDVGCGLGLHAIELTRRGYVVVGLDLSLPMLSRAADEAQDQGFKINFLHADMREMNFEGAFDAVLLWGTTLGYFDDDTNKQVLDRIHRALKPGGLLLLEVVNRDYAIRSQPNLVWFQGDACVVMEESSFNPISSRLAVKRNVILDDGRQRESTYSLRLYALHELGQVLHLRGFRVVEITGREATPGVFFGADSPKLIILAERRVQAPPAPPKKSDDGPKTGEATKLDAPKAETNGNGEPPS